MNASTPSYRIDRVRASGEVDVGFYPFTFRSADEAQKYITERHGFYRGELRIVRSPSAVPSPKE
jgi:hypothetical protein